MNSTVTHSPQQATPTTPVAQSSRGGETRDAELLRRFTRLKDEAAFAALVERHSRLVIGVCRRVLSNEHDIEDAFQAIFLVLARDAPRIRKQESLASWLHGVAYRTSLRAVSSSHRRRRLLREVTMTHDPADNSTTSGPLAELEDRAQRQALDEELTALPDNYRAVLVLHYLEEKSNQQVADDLGLTVTAVEGRLKRGKKELRLRLARRGIGLSVAVAAMQAAGSAASAAPLEPLIARTIDAGLSYAGGEAAGPVYTPEAARLAGQEIAAMSTTSAVTLATILLVPLTLGLSGHDAAYGTQVTGIAVSTLVSQSASDKVGENTLLASDAAGSGEVESKRVGGVSYGGEFGLDEDGGALGIGLGWEREVKPTSPAQHVVDYKVQSPNVMRIRAALESPTQIEFVDTPLADAMEYLSQKHDLQIQIDRSALKEDGIGEDEPINLIIEDVRLGSALNLILRNLGLTTILRDEVMTVTTTTVADSLLETRVYNTRHLPGIDPEQLAELLETSIPDAEWKAEGGSGTVTAIDGALVVMQTQTTHEKIVELLNQLQRHQAMSEQTPQTSSSNSSQSGAIRGIGMTDYANYGSGYGESASVAKSDSSINFNFRYAPWEEVLKVFAKATGWGIGTADVPAGSLTYVDDRDYTRDEALSLLNALLNARGYELVPHLGGLRCQKR